MKPLIANSTNPWVALKIWVPQGSALRPDPPGVDDPLDRSDQHRQCVDSHGEIPRRGRIG
jgi:hypothetical protein